MKHAFSLWSLLITLFVWLPGLGQEPVRDSIPFESLKGQLLMPVDRFTNLKTYEQWLNESKDRPLMGGCGVTKSLTIQSDSPMVVKNVAAGKVVSLFEVDGTYAVFVNHGKYYFVYCNLDSAFVKKDEAVTPGQLIGKILTKSYDGSYELELMLSSKNGDKVQDIDPYPWFAQSRYF